MITIKDVAKAANVSISTVSRVMNAADNVNPEISKRVWSEIRRLGYTPNNAARSLSRKSTNAIGVVVNNLHDPFFYNLIRGFEHGAAETNYSVVFCSAVSGDDKSKERYVRYLASGVTDGIILYGSYLSDEKIIEWLVDTNTDFVLIENNMESLHTNSLLIDNIGGAEKAVDYLYSQGHQLIAHISGNPNRKVSVDRFNGYLNSMHAHALDIKPDYIQYASSDYRSGYERMKTLLQLENRPTAVFCADDAIASFAVRAAVDSGLRVPEDISVMGFDNQMLLPDNYRGPGLTTMDQPLYEIGKDSIRIMTEVLERPETEKRNQIQKVYPTNIVIRDSVGAPPEILRP